MTQVITTVRITLIAGMLFLVYYDYSNWHLGGDKRATGPMDKNCA